MGYAIAEELAAQGAEVILVSGPVPVSTNSKNIKVQMVESAQDMFDASIKNFLLCDGAVMTAAVADFTPVAPEMQKVKRGNENYDIELKPTNDIAAALGALKKPGQLLVGFALETNNELDNARSKLAKKNLDFIVLNSLNDAGAGFGYDTNKVAFLDKGNKVQTFELKSKKEVAKDVVCEIISLMVG